jgi:hypothetical protein
MHTDVQKLAARLRDFSRGRDDDHSRAATFLESLDKEVTHWWRLSQRRQEEIKQLRQDLLRYQNLLGVKNVPPASVRELVALHNTARQKASRGWWALPPLREDNRLMEYAQDHALWMTNRNRLKHSAMADVLKLGFTRAGENIAWGQETPAAVLNSWLWSPGHRANIMSTRFNCIGAGVRRDVKGRLYWCVVFGTDSKKEVPHV